MYSFSLFHLFLDMHTNSLFPHWRNEGKTFIYLFIFGCEKGDLNVQYSMDEREIRHGKKGQPVGIEPV